MAMNSPKEGSRIDPRKQPKQKRSITRFQSILGSAEDLILEQGVIHMRMTDIAAHAGVPVGSVYQFFPEKAAILKAILDQRLVRLDEIIAKKLTGIADEQDAMERILALIDAGAELHKRDPVCRELWTAMSMDRDLALLQFRAYEGLVAILMDLVGPFVPERAEACLESRFRLVAILTGSVLRSVAEGHIPPDPLVQEWKRSVCDMLFPTLDYPEKQD